MQEIKKIRWYRKKNGGCRKEGIGERKKDIRITDRDTIVGRMEDAGGKVIEEEEGYMINGVERRYTIEIGWSRKGIGERRKDKGYEINGDARRSGRKDKEEGGIEEALGKIQ